MNTYEDKIKSTDSLLRYFEMCVNSNPYFNHLLFLSDKVYIPSKQKVGIITQLDIDMSPSRMQVTELINDNSMQRNLYDINHYDISDLILLPSTEQLMELIDIDMIKKYIKYTTIDTHFDYNRLLALTKWQNFISLQKKYSDYAHYFLNYSMNESLLVFIMYEKFNKQWDINKNNWIDF